MAVKTKSVKKSPVKSTKPAAKKSASKKSVKKVAKKSVKKAAPKKSVKKAAKKTVKKTVKTAPKKAVKKSGKSSVKKQTKALSSQSNNMPVVGQLAPDFALQSDNDGLVSLSKFRGKNIVLYFYPKDDTPGCTREACSFQENKANLSDAGAVVIGVSPDKVESHAKFRKKYGLDFVLVADTDHKLAEDYGIWVEKSMYGKTYMGIQRATFLIDRNGCIAYVWPKVSVDGHTEEVLEQLARL
jgi:peroxiredoxin Q/BCP